MFFWKSTDMKGRGPTTFSYVASFSHKQDWHSSHGGITITSGREEMPLPKCR